LGFLVGIVLPLLPTWRSWRWLVLSSSGQPGFPLSVAGGAPVIFIRLGEQVCPGRRVLNPLRRQACFLRLQAPVIGMAQKFGHCATSWSSLPVENSSKFLKLFREFGNSQKFCALQKFCERVALN
jgi:hypothetical protein